MPPKRNHDRLSLKSTDRICITGQPETGKTVFSQYLATLVDPKRLFIYDPLDQYKQFPDECRYVPIDEEPREEFNDICRQIMERGNVTFFIEEAQQYLPEGQSLLRYTAALINRGRNYGIGMVACTQRIQDLVKKFVGLCPTLIFFRCGFQSTAYLREHVGKEMAQRIEQLEDRQFIYYHERTGTYNVSTLKFPAGKLGPEGQIPKSVKLVEVEENE